MGRSIVNGKHTSRQYSCVEVVVVVHIFLVWVCLFVGNEVSALKSVPAAVYSFLRSMRPVSDIPDKVTA